LTRHNRAIHRDIQYNMTKSKEIKDKNNALHKLHLHPMAEFFTDAELEQIVQSADGNQTTAINMLETQTVLDKSPSSSSSNTSKRQIEATAEDNEKQDNQTSSRYQMTKDSVCAKERERYHDPQTYEKRKEHRNDRLKKQRQVEQDNNPAKYKKRKEDRNDNNKRQRQAEQDNNPAKYKKRKENRNDNDKKRHREEHDNDPEKYDKRKDDRNKRRREQYEKDRDETFCGKGTFQTLSKHIPCDTTEYEVAPTSAETAVINMYQCNGMWRLLWPLEDVQRLLNTKDKNGENKNKTTLKKDEENAIKKIMLLKKRVQLEKVTPEKQNIAGNNFFAALGRGCYWGGIPRFCANSVDARLLGCACCGIKEFYGLQDGNARRHSYLPLKQLDILKLNEEESLRYASQLMIQLKLPINQEGDCDIFYPWCVRSIYKDKDKESQCYYLHPELVIGDTQQPMAVICPDCAENIVSKGKIPPNSIADGIDLGYSTRIGLSELKDRELHIIAYVRYYYNIIKIESSARKGISNIQQSKLKGSSIMFEQDAPQVVSDLLSPETMNSNVFLHLVGHKGEFDRLYKKMMNSKTADVFGRGHVIYQWLSILKIINPLYKNLQLPQFQQFQDLLNVATKEFVGNMLKTFDNDLMEKSNQMKDDIAGVRHTTNIHMQPDDENVMQENDANGTLPEEINMSHSYLANTQKTQFNSNTDSTHTYAMNVAETIGLNVEKEKEEYEKAKSFRSQYPINEFTEGRYGLVAAFPHVFMFGTAYKKDTSNLKLKDCQHCLLQFTAVPAKCKILQIFLYDIQRRHQNIQGMAASRKQDPLHFDEFANEFMSVEFQDKIRHTVEDPTAHKDSRYILRKLLPKMTTAAKNTSFGALERTSALGDTYAMLRRYGPEFELLTIAIDDVTNPSIFRLTFSHPDNINFPSITPQEFLTAMEQSKPFVSGNITIPTNWSALAAAVVGNPVASSFVYRQLVQCILQILVGLRPSRLSGGKINRKKVSPRFTKDSVKEQGGVIAGHTQAYNGVHEVNARGSLHSHIMIWAAICPALLQGVADIKEVCDIVCQALDSMFCATIPRQYHVKDLLEKEMRLFSTKTIPHQRTIRRGRMMMIPPDPKEVEKYNDYTNTAITSVGIHYHEKDITGRCHKPPKGITRCSLSKPSRLIDRTKPVQLIDCTLPKATPSEKIEIQYTINTKMQDRQDAINSLPPEQQVGPEFKEIDPRLIVYEPKRPAIDILPEQDEDSTKEWIIEELIDAMYSGKGVEYNDDYLRPQLCDSIVRYNKKRKSNTSSSINCSCDPCSAIMSTITKPCSVCNANVHQECQHDNERKNNWSVLTRVYCNSCHPKDKARPPDSEMEHVVNELDQNLYETESISTTSTTETVRASNVCSHKQTYEQGSHKNSNKLPNNHHNSNKSRDTRTTQHLSFMNEIEINNIVIHLEGMDVQDLRVLYNTVSEKLKDRNGYVADYNPTLAGMLGSHSNALLLGSHEQSKVAAHYVGPYVDKYKTSLAESIEVVHESLEHATQYPSIAEDAGTKSRFVQHVLTAIMNRLGCLMEITDTQISGALLGLTVGICSDSFTVCDTDAYLNFIKNEQKYQDYDSSNDSDENYTNDSSSENDNNDDENSMDEFIVSDKEEEDEPDQILRSLLESSDDEGTNNDPLLNRIKNTLNQMENVTTDLPRAKLLRKAYGACPLYRVDNGTTLVAIPWPFHYRWRGKALENINRIEYCGTVLTKKNKKSDNDNSPSNVAAHLQYKSGRKASVTYEFGKGMEIQPTHHQTMRSNQCTVKFYKGTPQHPGQKPKHTKDNSHELVQWKKKANKFAEFYLMLFRPEIGLYESGQKNNYGYKWEDLHSFMTYLKRKEGTDKELAIDRFRYDYMNTMINSLKTSRRNRTILCDYREKNATRWSEQERKIAYEKYQHRMRRKNGFDDDDDENELDANMDREMMMGLSNRKELEIMQKVAFTDQLKTQLDLYARRAPTCNKDSNSDSMGIDAQDNDITKITYPVQTDKYNELLAQTILEKPTKEDIDEENDESEHDVGPRMFFNKKGEEVTLDEKIRELKGTLSQDKICAFEIMQEHFKHVRDGSANENSYAAPALQITGKPGTGKSWLIRSITELAEIMDLETTIRTAYMGIASINIQGLTMNSFLDIPIEMSKQSGTSKRVKPWDPDRLQAFKEKYDVDHLSAIIIDEISMVKPWMLAYVDARMREATQEYDKPFGGVAVILFGDFNQQPPIGGSSLPHLSISILEKENERKNKMQFVKKSRQDKVEIESTLNRKGIRLFQDMPRLVLTQQHRCATDPIHMANLDKMSSGSKMTPKDLEIYQTVSQSKLNQLEDLLFATIIVTGNYERQELNAFVANLWAHYFHTHVIRWQKHMKYNQWKGRPQTDKAIKHAMQQSCFYEYFVPNSPAYLIPITST
jgi:hypothetical protein